MFEEEISWIQQMAIKDFNQYYESERIGRKDTRIERINRKYFYEVYEEYINIRGNNSSPYYYDFEDIGSVVGNIINHISNNISEKVDYLVDYIIIDEFQDFTYDMLQTINQLINHSGTLVLLGDINQGVFGKRISFKSLGINLNTFGRHTLNYNYRNSKQISALSSIVAESPYFDKHNDFYIKGEIGKHHEREPKIIKHLNENHEMENIYRYIKSTDNSIGIIVQTHKIGQLKDYLRSQGIDIQTNKQVSLYTYKQVKGLEFDTVIMPFLSRSNFNKMLSNDNKVKWTPLSRHEFYENKVGLQFCSFPAYSPAFPRSGSVKAYCP